MALPFNVVAIVWLFSVVVVVAEEVSGRTNALNSP